MNDFSLDILNKFVIVALIGILNIFHIFWIVALMLRIKALEKMIKTPFGMIIQMILFFWMIICVIAGIIILLVVLL